MVKNKSKIMLVQITNKNFGDSVIADNTRFLLKRALPFWAKNEYDILDYSIGTEDLGQIKYVDAIVFAGGGLVKFKQENLYRQVSEIIEEAQKYDIPVFLNSVGVEGFDSEDDRCIQIKNAINQPCVKGISVRDDVQLLMDKYIENQGIRVSAVFDPAIWSGITYKGMGSEGKQECIGLGVARENLFIDYGIGQIDREFMLQFWKEVALRLEKEGLPWKIFTNGLDADERFAEEVLQFIGHGEKVVRPANQLQLIDRIRSFQGIIACRMHANIIAYAMGIPSVGLVWNDKMAFWGQKIGYPERFIPAEKLVPETVVDAFMGAYNDRTAQPSWKKKKQVYKELRWFVRKFCKKKNFRVEDLEFEKQVFATAMGGAEFKYKNMNNLSVLSDSIHNGKYKLVEADVRMSEDHKLVCVNGWNQRSLKMLGVASDEAKAMSMQEFLQSKYYGYYATASYYDFIRIMSELLKMDGDMVFILDVGKPKAEIIDIYYQQLVEGLREFKIPPHNIIVKLQRKKDVKAFKEHKYKCEIVTELSSFVKTDEIITALKNGSKYVGSHYYSVDYLNRLTK